MKLINKIVSVFFILAGLTVFVLQQSMPVQAQTSTGGAKVSFTFDDGFLSTYTHALPVLSARNVKATLYVTSGFINSGVTDDYNLPAMSWSQVQSLQNDYGWEIGGHTYTHLELPTLTTAQVQQQLASSSADFQANGINVTNFASPFGAYDNQVLIEVLKYYESHRGFADLGYETYPRAKAVLKVQQVNSDTTVAQVKGYIDAAKANNQWLILVFHHVAPTLDPNYEYTTTIADLGAIADYALASGVEVTRVADQTHVYSPSLTTNAGFELGLTQGWTVGNPTQVTLDTNSNGNYPNPTSAVKMTGSSTASHLFSSNIDASTSSDYLVDAFANTTGLTAGEFGFYLDEYDSNNNWISGQWLGKVANNTVGFFQKVIRATSNLVARFSLQSYLTAGAVGTVFTDNQNLYNLSAPTSTPVPTATPTPTPTPTALPTPTPTPTPSATPIATDSANLALNPSFETVASNFAQNWTRSLDTAFLLNTASQGTDGTNSVEVIPQAVRAHLFSARIPVTQQTYTWRQDISTSQAAGEFGFYIDEYNANGDWISGQWKGAVFQQFNGTWEISYTPSSAQVSTIGLQYYILENSVFNLLLDNIRFTSTVLVTPTPTATPSATPTPTPSATPEVTPTPTPTPTATPEVTPTPTPTPTATPVVTPTPTATPVAPTPTPTPGAEPTNLVLNPSFEIESSNWVANWVSDLMVAFGLDTSSNGTTGTHSLHIVPQTYRAHLFSDFIAVNQATYVWRQDVKTTQATGEFGFYIDEYNSNGDWVSGQWKGAVFQPTNGMVEFTYTPSSSAVTKVRLQYYILENSAFTLYLDNVRFGLKP